MLWLFRLGALWLPPPAICWGGGTSSESEVVETEKTLREVAGEKRAEADAAAKTAEEAAKTAEEKATAAEQAVADAEAAKEAAEAAEAAIEPAKAAAEDAANAVDAMQDANDAAVAAKPEAEKALKKAQDTLTSYQEQQAGDQEAMDKVSAARAEAESAADAVTAAQDAYDAAIAGKDDAEKALKKVEDKLASYQAQQADDQAAMAAVVAAQKLVDEANDETRAAAQAALDAIEGEYGTVEEIQIDLDDDAATIARLTDEVANAQSTVDGINETIDNYEKLSAAKTNANKALDDLEGEYGTVDEIQIDLDYDAAAIARLTDEVSDAQKNLDVINGVIAVYDKLVAEKEAADKAANEAVENAEATKKAAEDAEAAIETTTKAAEEAKEEAEKTAETAKEKETEALEAEAAADEADEADKTVLVEDGELSGYTFDGYETLGAWDICWSLHGVCVEYTAGTPQTITLPYKAVDGETYVVFHGLTDGTFEKITPTVKDGVISFTTTSFSPFILAKEEVAVVEPGDETTDPKTDEGETKTDEGEAKPDEGETKADEGDPRIDDEETEDGSESADPSAPDTGALSANGEAAGAQTVASLGAAICLAATAFLTFAIKRKSVRK